MGFLCSIELSIFPESKVIFLVFKAMKGVDTLCAFECKSVLNLFVSVIVEKRQVGPSTRWLADTGWWMLK